MSFDGGDQNQNSIILIDGATGYLGSHLVSCLTKQGFKVRCLTRKGSSKKDIQFLEDLTDDIIEVDFKELSDEKANEVFHSVTHLVHLIGSIAPKKGETLSELHQNYTEIIVEYGRKFNLKKLIHVTALGASAKSPSVYHRTKWMAEEVVRASGIDYTILRPSLIIGREVGFRDSKLVKRLLNFILRKPYVPLINGGVNKIQPIFVNDVVEAIKCAITNDDQSKTLELGGSKTIEMRELVFALADHLGKKVKIFPLNDKFGKLVASILERVQDVPVISSDQVVLSLTDNICQENNFEDLVGRKPVSLADSIATYNEPYIQTL